MAKSRIDRIERIRTVLNYMNMNRLEKITGLSRQSLYDFRSGKRMISAEKFIILEDALKDITDGFDNNLEVRLDNGA